LEREEVLEFVVETCVRNLKRVAARLEEGGLSPSEEARLADVWARFWRCLKEALALKGEEAVEADLVRLLSQLPAKEVKKWLRRLVKAGAG
jgi:hypothetical protein